MPNAIKDEKKKEITERVIQATPEKDKFKVTISSALHSKLLKEAAASYLQKQKEETKSNAPIINKGLKEELTDVGTVSTLNKEHPVVFSVQLTSDSKIKNTFSTRSLPLDTDPFLQHAKDLSQAKRAQSSLFMAKHRKDSSKETEPEHKQPAPKKPK